MYVDYTCEEKKDYISLHDLIDIHREITLHMNIDI